MPKYVSGRVKTNPPLEVADDRYQYLDPSDAEPNLGTPPDDGFDYVLVSSGIGTRSWARPAPTGAITGITVRDDGVVVGTANSIAQLNFEENLYATASGFAATVGLTSNLTGIVNINATGVITASTFVGAVEAASLTNVNYVESISGTTNQILVTGGTGNASTPSVSLTDDVIIVNDLTIGGNLTVNGTLTVNTYVVSSSVINETTVNVSGSTRFGNSIDDTHQLRRRTLICQL